MSGALLTVEISAAVSAVTGAAAGKVWTWAGAAMAAVRWRLIPDHRPLYDADWRLTAAFDSTHPRFAIRVTCAPNRSLGRAELDPDVAIRFVHEAFPGIYADRPEHSSSRSGVRFLPREGPGNIWVWRSGRIDLEWYLPPGDGGNLPRMDAIELLRPVALIASAVSHPRYVQLFGRRFQRHRRRFDWFIVVSPTLRENATSESRPWAEVVFPVPAPPRAGSNQTPFSPVDGFASSALRDWKPAARVRQALALFLEDYLKVNGYHDVSPAVDGTVDYFISHRAPDRPSCTDMLEVGGGAAG